MYPEGLCNGCISLWLYLLWEGFCNPDSSVGGNSDSRRLRSIVRGRETLHRTFLNPQIIL